MLPCFPADQDLWALLGACQNQDITRFKSLKPLNLRLPPEMCIKELMSRHAEIQQEECIVMQLMYDVWGGCVVAALTESCGVLQPKGNMLLFQFTILFLVVSSFIFDVLTKQATGCPKTVCLFSSTKFTSIASGSQRCPNTLWHLSLCSAQVFSFPAEDLDSISAACCWTAGAQSTSLTFPLLFSSYFWSQKPLLVIIRLKKNECINRTDTISLLFAVCGLHINQLAYIHAVQ